MVRPPQPPVFMFVIDVSYTAVVTGGARLASRAQPPSLHMCRVRVAEGSAQGSFCRAQALQRDVD